MTEVEQTQTRIFQLLTNPATQGKAFDLLYDTYGRKLYGHILRYVGGRDDAADVFQNTMIKAWKALQSFRGDAQLSTWLYKIATNESINHINQQKRKAVISIDHGELPILGSLEADTDMDTAAALDKLQQAIDTLPNKQKLVFTLRYYEEMSYEQMSGQLGTSVGALKASFHHAVAKIEKFICNRD
ncbi:MAG: sigma-70 family RNA polymerase sigma factor [Bacteroidetes bacterium]|jgi:RNA polymerase sigma-70 factor (ECF subfamily)|nr:sigma-70 family RNA polymerase sigma factor [Bacteroidota bacterium]